ncbi:hypothetical protein GOP47_0021835 [Adiantum capillus-veneris]|uniref:DDE Tnp4 domain-containing protein n=1 Tax=Adiantum capillus-veneris TaxID=13818 RepID=A0A9D4U955_ADICA|nr:hypothetical protein GOP47_0021835 [Adiantum capillus-veneris]
MSSSRGSRRQQRGGGTTTTTRPDPRVIVPSVSAAAHCAQSCLRFWNLLLQDAASVNPFGLSTEGYDRAEEDDEEEAHQFVHDEDHDPLSFPLQAVDEDDDHDEKQGGSDEENLALYSNGYPIPRPESYMKPRTIHWWNHHVCFAREDDPSFIAIFRLPVGFLTTICDLCQDDMRQGEIPPSLRHVEGRIMSVERQVAIAVMRLTTGSTFKTVSELLGCGRSTVVKIVNKFVSSVRQRAGHYLQWPSTPEQSTRVKDGFFSRYGLANCCGILDTTHIIMDLPSGEPADIWLDRNHTFSMALQAVVDTELRFLDVCVGYPGSLSDAKCLRESAFYKKCTSGQRLNGEHMQAGRFRIAEYVVADLEYPLLPWLMRPFKENELTTQRTLYNDTLSLTRIAMARTFGRLKGAFRIFHGTVKQPNLERMPKMIHACCIMHNMCIEAGGVEGVYLPEPETVLLVDMALLDGEDAEESDDAFQAREVLCTHLSSLPGFQESQGTPPNEMSIHRNLQDYMSPDFTHLWHLADYTHAASADFTHIAFDREDTCCIRQTAFFLSYELAENESDCFGRRRRREWLTRGWLRHVMTSIGSKQVVEEPLLGSKGYLRLKHDQLLNRCRKFCMTLIFSLPFNGGLRFGSSSRPSEPPLVAYVRVLEVISWGSPSRPCLSHVYGSWAFMCWVGQVC